MDARVKLLLRALPIALLGYCGAAAGATHVTPLKQAVEQLGVLSDVTLKRLSDAGSRSERWAAIAGSRATDLRCTSCPAKTEAVFTSPNLQPSVLSLSIDSEGLKGSLAW